MMICPLDRKDVERLQKICILLLKLFETISSHQSGRLSMQNEAQVERHCISDEQLIERVLNREKNVYEVIMRKYNQRLFRIARSYILNEDEVEDLIQETYMKAYEQLPHFEKRSSFSTWLIRILINEALKRLNHRKRLASFTYDRSEHPAFDREAHEESPMNDNPLGQLMNTELGDVLERAVDRLPEKYSSVFVMREVEGMSIAETSEALEITETNVKVRLNRAKEMLRETITDSYHDVNIFRFHLVRCDRIVRGVLRRLDG